MDHRYGKDAARDRVYHAIKAMAIAYAFPQGKRIYLQPLADALGVSTTPVREALNRLAAEDLVIKAPRKGFIAITLSEANILGYYELTSHLLTRELEQLSAAARNKLSQFEPIATILYKLNRRVISDANTLAARTGEVFLAIASLSENTHVIRSIDRANDHLYYIRTIEYHHLADAQDELKRLCELTLAELCQELVRMIRLYYDDRVRALPALLALAQGVVRESHSQAGSRKE